MRYPITFLMCVMYLTGTSQLENAMAQLENGGCEAVLSTYRTYVDDQSLQIIAYWGLAYTYSEPGCSQYNLHEAYQWLEKCYKLYRPLEDRDKERLGRRGLGSVAKVRNRITEGLYAAALASGQANQLDSFVSRYPLARRSLQDDATEHALRLRLQQLQRQPETPAAWGRWMATYSDKLTPYTGLRDTAEHLVADAWVREKGWGAWAEFNRSFPNNRYGLDRMVAGFSALQAKGSYQDYQLFAERNTTSRWAPIARDSAQAIRSRVLFRQTLVTRALDTLSLAAQPEAYARADQQLARGYVTDCLQPAFLKRLAAVPGERAPITLDSICGRYRAAGQLELFLTTFPTYPRKAQVEAELTAERARREAARQKQLAEEQAERQRKAEEYRQQQEQKRKQELRIQEEIRQKRIADSLTIVRSTPEASGCMVEATRAMNKREQLANKWRSYQFLVTSLSPFIEKRDWANALLGARRDSSLAGFVYYDELIQMLSSQEKDPQLQFLGDSAVNTQAEEYTPVLSVDGKLLYFCRKVNDLERIFVARLNPEGWVDLGKAPALNNSTQNMAPLSLSVDGNQLILFKGGIMLYSSRSNQGWSAPQPYPSTINGGSWQGMGSLSSDGRVMIFEVKGRPEQARSLGDNIDLYISFLLSDGTWTKGIPLGGMINTPYMDRSPYLHPDMRTLYFSTDGRGGLGGMDVYKTTRLGDGWFCWSEPQHLGRAVNTAGHDWGYKVTTDGRYAYFSGDPDANGSDDIYKVELPEAARPEPVTLIESRIVTPDGKPIEGDLQVEDLSTGEVVARLRADPETGRVTTALPNNRKYALVFEGGQRMPLSNSIDLSKVDSNQVITQDIVLSQVSDLIRDKTGIVLNNLFFDYGESTLKPESFAEIKRIANILANMPAVNIEIGGHTDNSSSKAFNLGLSQRRAETVRQAFIELGVPAARITAVGYGPDQPTATNDTEAGRALNRRVEMKLRE